MATTLERLRALIDFHTDAIVRTTARDAVQDIERLNSQLTNKTASNENVRVEAQELGPLLTVNPVLLTCEEGKVSD